MGERAREPAVWGVGGALVLLSASLFGLTALSTLKKKKNKTKLKKLVNSS